VKFNAECAEPIITGIGMNLAAVQQCMGVIEGEHPLLEVEKTSQVGTGTRGDVTINPTIIINRVHYRGKLESGSLVQALCAGFSTGQEPEICLNPGVSDRDCEPGKKGFNECSARTDGFNHCKETFRGYECDCPEGAAAYKDADGTSKCSDENECKGVAMELDSCNCPRCVCVNQVPGFMCMEMPSTCGPGEHKCWENEHASACMDQIDQMKAAGVGGHSPRNLRPYNCTCPSGYAGDGLKAGAGCKNVNECETRCRGEDMQCEDTEGSFVCKCSEGVYDAVLDTCIEGRSGGAGISAVTVTLIVVGLVAAFAIGGYALYKYRLRSYMDAEIRAIMSQYMPLDEKADDDAVGGDPFDASGGDEMLSEFPPPGTQGAFQGSFQPPAVLREDAEPDGANQL